MKVDGQYPKLPVHDKSAVKGKDKQPGPVENSKTGKVSRADTNTFAVNRMREKIDNEPDINLEKVRALKAKIKNGEYQVDSDRLAGNLLRNSLLEDI